MVVALVGILIRNGMANDRTWATSVSVFGGLSHETGDAGYTAPQTGKGGE